MICNREVFLTICTFSFLIRAIAVCPNFCGGHGTCNPNNRCTCNPGWDSAPDCSLRTCPFGLAWADKAYATDTAHAPTECAGAGICNRFIGRCDCFSPFVGSACQRLRCPKDCSGNGICMTMADITNFYGAFGASYTNWDKDSTTMCVCDEGFFGSDCTSRMCPKGDDPVTTNQNFRSVSVEVQITNGGTISSGTASFRFNGETVALQAFGLTDAACGKAISGLGNVGTAICVVNYSTGGNSVTVDITFESWPAIPVENNLWYHNGNPTLSSFSCDATNVVSTLSSPVPVATCSITDLVNSDITEYTYCSRRGRCNFSEGICSCHQGWTGIACSLPSQKYSAANSLPGISLLAEGNGYSGNIIELDTTFPSSPAFNFIEGRANGNEIFSIDGTGSLEVQGLRIASLKGDSLNMGDLIISDGMSDISSSIPNLPVLDLTSTSTAYISNLLAIEANPASIPSSYNFIHAQVNQSDTIFSVRGDGLVNISGSTGGLQVAKGSVTITTGSISLDNGSMFVPAGLVHANGIISGSIVTVNSEIESTGSIKTNDILMSTGLISAGTATVSTGGLKIEMGGFEVLAGKSLVDASLQVSGGVLVDDVGIDVITGDISILNGGLFLSGAITTSAGIITVGTITINNGGLIITSGTVTIATGGLSSAEVVTASGGLISASGLTVSSGGSAVSGTVTIATEGLSSAEVVTASGGVISPTSMYALSFVTSSDIRLKDHIFPLETSLEGLLKLSGVRFIWREGSDQDGIAPESDHIGFIAQDV